MLTDDVPARRGVLLAAMALALGAGRRAIAETSEDGGPNRDTANDVVPIIKLLERPADDLGPRRQEFRPITAGKFTTETTGDIDMRERQLPIWETFVADLSVTYGFDQPDAYRLLNAGDLAALGLDRDGLRRTAIANWRRRHSKIDLVRAGRGVLGCAGLLYSSLLLVAEVWEERASQSRNELLAGVPTRDVILFTDGGRPDFESLRSRIARIRDSRRDHPLSSRIFSWKNGGWEIWA